MKSLLALVRAAASASLLLAGIVVAAGVVSAQTAGATERTVTIQVEYYGWYTNSPPGCQTADSSIRDGCAGGKGTYTTPITAAVDPADYPYGTLFYYPSEKRYFEAGDEDPGGSFTALTWWMGYLGTSTATNAGTPFGLIDCEDALTVATATGTTTPTPVIVTPPKGLPVTTQPLFTYVTSRCYGGATSPSTFDQYKNRTDGLCIENPTYGTTVGTPAQLAPCKAYTVNTKTSEGQDLEYEGNWFYNHGLCLKSVSKSAPKWTKCTGETTKEYWYTGLKFPTTSNVWTRVAEPSVGLASSPGKPTVTPGNKKATVSWSASATDGAFPILRYTVDASPGGDFCTTTGLSCTVTGLKDGTTYTFTVVPWSIAGTGTASAATMARLATTAPTAPAQPSAIPGYNSATVSWSAPTTNGSAITSYKVTASPGGRTCVSTSATLSCTISKLKNGTSYTFSVTATNGVGTSPASLASAAVVPGTPTPPAKPGATRGNQSAMVTWTASTTTNGFAVTSYTVTSSPGTKTCSPSTVTTTPLSCTVGTLTNGTPYTFTVTATNKEGTSNPSSASTAVTPATVPSAPARPTATGANRSAKVTWTAPTDGGTAITSYTVTSSPGTKSCTSSTTTCTVGTLTNGTPYTFSVTATNGVGTGAASTPSTAVIPAPTVPSAPARPTATAGYESATVTWTAPATNGTPITRYTVTSTKQTKTCTWTSGPLTCTVKTLKDGTRYEFTVKAHNGIGTSAASSRSSSVTPTKQRPSAPAKPTAMRGTKSATVSWSPATANGTAITKYTVTSSPGAETCTSASSPCTVETLTNGMPYTFTVTATNGKGTSASSPASTPVTPAGAPSAPGKPSATRGNQSATVSWTAATTDGTAITSYTATSSPGALTCSPTTLSTPSCTVTGLTNGTPYTFTVTATNDVGTGAASTRSTAVTPAGVPFAPTKPSVARGDEKVTVSWTAATTNGSPITSYVVTSSTGHHTCTATTGELSCTIRKLTNGDSYTFIVVAHNGIGASSKSTPSTAVAPAGVPSAPGKPTAKPGNKKATVTWSASTTTNGSPIVSYVVISTTGHHKCTAATGALSCTVKKLTNGTSYSFTVKAHNAIGASVASAPSTGVTPET